MNIGLLLFVAIAFIVGYVLLKVAKVILFWFVLALVVIGLVFGWNYSSSLLNKSVNMFAQTIKEANLSDKVKIHNDSVDITFDGENYFSTKDLKITSDVKEDEPIVIETKDGKQYTFNPDDVTHKILLELYKNELLSIKN